MSNRAFINGFVKRAMEYGFSQEYALSILKKAEDEDEEPFDKFKRIAKKRFYYWKNKLKNRGVYAGTYHKRVAIPKKSISKEILENMGYEPVLIAIPESGQDEFASYRHPDNLLHLHSHGDHWTMHEDAHPSLTMALRKAHGKEIPKAIYSGLSHIFTEGVPGAYKYVANRIGGSGDMLDAIMRESSVKNLKMR